MDIKLFDSELKVMSVLWREGDAKSSIFSASFSTLSLEVFTPLISTLLKYK